MTISDGLNCYCYNQIRLFCRHFQASSRIQCRGAFRWRAREMLPYPLPQNRAFDTIPEGLKNKNNIHAVKQWTRVRRQRIWRRFRLVALVWSPLNSAHYTRGAAEGLSHYRHVHCKAGLCAILRQTGVATFVYHCTALMKGRGEDCSRD